MLIASNIVTRAGSRIVQLSRKGVPIWARPCTRSLPTSFKTLHQVSFRRAHSSVMKDNVVFISREAERAFRRGRAAGKLPRGSHQAVAEAASDEALLQSIAEGEQRAMGMLYARHNTRVFRFALSITKNRSLAEDVVSDVFFDVWRCAGSFRGRSRVATWLLGIARHKGLSLLQRPAHEALTEELAETIEDTADDPEHSMQRKQAGAMLADCLLRLPTIHREIIDLVYYHQKSIEEVAEILRVPRNTVKTRMFYARKGLAQMLAVRTDESVSLLS